MVENAKIEKFKCDILIGQKFIKNAKNGQFDEFLKTKLMENAKIEKLKCDILDDFQTLCTHVLPVFWVEMPYIFCGKLSVLSVKYKLVEPNKKSSVQ